jgi:hypothetical protein
MPPAPDRDDLTASPFRSFTGWTPLALASAALVLLAGYWLTGPHAPNMVLDHGVRRADEGAVARLWQLLMLAQLAAIALFLFRWAPRAPRSAMLMAVLQVCGLVAAALPVWLLEH